MSQRVIFHVDANSAFLSWSAAYRVKVLGESQDLRLEDETHQLMRVDIEEIVNIRQVQYVGIEATVFLCRATVRQKLWLFELKYTIRTHTWSLMRKVC